MYKLGLVVALCSYTFFTLGLIGILNQNLIIFTTILFLFTLLFLFIKENNKKELSRKIKFFTHTSTIQKLLVILLLIQGLINLLGVFAPETAFDALWYHLTIPKIFFIENRIFHIPGGLLYYSDMPKLVDLLFMSGYVLKTEFVSKLISFSFSVLTLFVLYKTSRLFFDKTLSLLVLVVFYSNLVVAWLSTTAYIDLGRTFFEILSLYLIILFINSRKVKFLNKSGLMMGFAVASKILAFTSLISMSITLLMVNVKLKKVLFFITIAFLPVLPWLIFSFINTGNPVYPFFSDIYKIHGTLNFSGFANFVHSQDPISPIYLLCLPFLLIYYKKIKLKLNIVFYYSVIFMVFWVVSPQTGGGRFITPILPALSLLVGGVVFFSEKTFKKILIIAIIFISVVTIIYRGMASVKYIPVVFRIETKEQFLSKNLNYSFGDFYDVDSYFKKNIYPKDTVLIYGVHNLYYVNFSYIHESWVKKGDKFNYILIQNGELPKRFKDSKLVYQNSKTHVKLYKKIKGTWQY